MEENRQSQNIPLLCRKGCGFYGSPNFDGFCSKCHNSNQAQVESVPQVRVTSVIKDKLVESDNNSSNSGDSSEIDPIITKTDLHPTSGSTDKGIKYSSSTPELQVNNAQTDLSDSFLNDLKSDSKPDSPASTCSSDLANKKRPRCTFCNKRVGLTGFTCRCGGLYCALHRYSDTHSCSFDYKESGQEEIRRSNPQIIRQKVQKI